MIPQDIKDMSDEELDNEILRFEQLEADRMNATVALVINLLGRVKDLESKFSVLERHA